MQFYNRRVFLNRFLSALAGAAGFLLAACSSGGSSNSSGGGGTCASATTGSSGTCSLNGATSSVGSNHGHTAPSVASADVTGGVAKTYTVGAGTAGHSHTVTVCTGDFATLNSNVGVQIASDVVNGHSHVITFTCS